MDLTKNKEFEAMAKEGGEKMHAAVESAMKKLNIKPPGPPAGMANGKTAPDVLNAMMPGKSASKRSSSPYKQRRF